MIPSSLPDQTRNEEKMVKPVFCIVDTVSCFILFQIRDIPCRCFWTESNPQTWEYEQKSIDDDRNYILPWQTFLTNLRLESFSANMPDLALHPWKFEAISDIFMPTSSSFHYKSCRVNLFWAAGRWQDWCSRLRGCFNFLSVTSLTFASQPTCHLSDFYFPIFCLRKRDTRSMQSNSPFLELKGFLLILGFCSCFFGCLAFLQN